MTNHNRIWTAIANARITSDPTYVPIVVDEVLRGEHFDPTKDGTWKYFNVAGGLEGRAKLIRASWDRKLKEHIAIARENGSRGGYMKAFVEPGMEAAGYDYNSDKDWQHLGVAGGVAERDQIICDAYIRGIKRYIEMARRDYITPSFMELIRHAMEKAKEATGLDLDYDSDASWRLLGENGLVARDYLIVVLEAKQRLNPKAATAGARGMHLAL